MQIKYTFLIDPILNRLDDGFIFNKIMYFIYIFLLFFSYLPFYLFISFLISYSSNLNFSNKITLIIFIFFYLLICLWIVSQLFWSRKDEFLVNSIHNEYLVLPIISKTTRHIGELFSILIFIYLIPFTIGIAFAFSYDFDGIYTKNIIENILNNTFFNTFINENFILITFIFSEIIIAISIIYFSRFISELISSRYKLLILNDSNL